jgi:hypothetical protein
MTMCRAYFDFLLKIPHAITFRKFGTRFPENFYIHCVSNVLGKMSKFSTVNSSSQKKRKKIHTKLRQEMSGCRV